MTKYSCDIYSAGNWESEALFSDKISIPAMICFADQQFDLGTSVDNIRIVDLETGELIFDWENDHYWPDDDCDNDMGFDPYLGYYTDDC